MAAPAKKDKAPAVAKKAPAPEPKRRRSLDEDDSQATSSGGPVVGDGKIDTPEEALEAALERVAAEVPRAFRLRLSNHAVIAYPAGAYMMDKAHAEHWYAQANGVKIISNGKK